METKPKILIVSNNSTKPGSIIKLITKEQLQTTADKLIIQPWTITTKYYSAMIDLVGYSGTVQDFHKEIVKFPDGFEGVIFHIDTNKTIQLQELLEWLEVLGNICQPEIKLLLANYCNKTTKISKDEANLWCLNNGFEFIELYPSEDSSQVSNEECEPFGIEKHGIERVIEALENNVWSNIGSSYELSEDDDPVPNEEFMELFSNLLSYKSSVSSLPTNARKQAAEQMVTAFWKAIGGDDDELSDI